MSKPTLRTVRSLWGVEESWETVLPKIKANGYYAIETNLHLKSEKEQERFKDLLEKNGLKLVCQMHTDSNAPGQRSKDIEHHINNFRAQLTKAKEFGVIFCNSHSGYDGWNAQQKEQFFKACLEIEKEIGIPCNHETHRRRVMFNPWDTRDILLKFPHLKVTADLSHFFCVMSNDLDDEMDIIKLIAERTNYIHARVGYDNGPQVSDPRTPENFPWVEAHERLWDVIWRTQAQKKVEYSYLNPEFGPPSYMHALPYTNVPVVNLWEVTEWQAKRQIERFNNFSW